MLLLWSTVLDLSIYRLSWPNRHRAGRTSLDDVRAAIRAFIEEQSRNLPAGKLAELREEIGDVMIYLTELAEKLGIDPVEAARAKVEINRQKYPADLVKGKASKYTEY